MDKTINSKISSYIHYPIKVKTIGGICPLIGNTNNVCSSQILDTRIPGIDKQSYPRCEKSNIQQVNSFYTQLMFQYGTTTIRPVGDTTELLSRPCNIIY